MRKYSLKPSIAIALITAIIALCGALAIIGILRLNQSLKAQSIVAIASAKKKALIIESEAEQAQIKIMLESIELMRGKVPADYLKLKELQIKERIAKGDRAPFICKPGDNSINGLF